VYVEGEKPMIAELIVRKMFTTEPGEYIGEFDCLSEIFKVSDGLIVEGVSNEAYKFIRGKGLVYLMAKYWDQFIEEREKEFREIKC
jgi:hypothetical protein